MILYLASHGRLNEAIELERLLNEGKIQVNETTTNHAEVRNGIIYVSDELLLEPTWSNTGNTKENEAVASEIFNNRVWLAGILLHEGYHVSHGGTPSNNEVAAWRAQREWFQNLLNDPYLQLTAEQIRLINLMIAQCNTNIRKYGGTP